MEHKGRLNLYHLNPVIYWLVQLLLTSDQVNSKWLLSTLHFAGRKTFEV